MSLIEKKIVDQLTSIYDAQEAVLIAKYLLVDLFDGGQVDEAVLDKAIQRLRKAEPLQYITGKAYFLNYVFYVNQSVLIPRPETEELVMIAREHIQSYGIKHVLEIGTGSGCIAIAIKKKCPHVTITAIDISLDALEVAKKNAFNLNAEIEFIHMDFLNEKCWPLLPHVDLIVSNPPYISYAEKEAMHANVLAHEPHIALFAGDDTLAFYKAIAKYGHQTGAPSICEINEHFPHETKAIFENVGYKNVTLNTDLQGKDRVVRAM